MNSLPNYADFIINPFCRYVPWNIYVILFLIRLSFINELKSIILIKWVQLTNGMLSFTQMYPLVLIGILRTPLIN